MLEGRWKDKTGIDSRQVEIPAPVKIKIFLARRIKETASSIELYSGSFLRAFMLITIQGQSTMESYKERERR